MKKYFNILINVLSILFFWLLSGFLFKYDNDYYSLLNIPSFALNKAIISTLWIILFILISISIYLVKKKTNIFKNRDYFYILITNYLSNQLFCYFFFTLKSPLMGFVMTTICMISSIFLFIETKAINKKASYFLIPYIVFSIYAFILSVTIFVMNF